MAEINKTNLMNNKDIQSSKTVIKIDNPNKLKTLYSTKIVKSKIIKYNPIKNKFTDKYKNKKK